MNVAFTGRYSIEWVSHSVNKHTVSIYVDAATTLNVTATVPAVVQLTDFTTHTGWTGRPYEQILYSTFVPPTKQFALYYRNNNHDFYIAQGYIPSTTHYDFSTGNSLILSFLLIFVSWSRGVVGRAQFDTRPMRSSIGEWHLVHFGCFKHQ